MNRTNLKKFKYPNRKNGKKNGQNGQVLIAMVILFLALSLAVVMGMSVPIANQIKAGSDLETSRRSYATAEVGNEEIFYRLNKSKTIPTSLVLAIASTTSSLTVSDNGDSKIVTSTGLSGTYQRLTRTTFTRPRSVPIIYSMLIGTSSITGANNANITGDIYVNASVSGINVTAGSVTAANVKDPVTVESFDMSTSGSGLTNIMFWTKANGGIPAVQDLAQSFTISSATPINAIGLYLKKTASSFSGATIKIVNDSSGKPGATIYGSGTFSSGSLSTAGFGLPYISFSSNISLTPGVTYWIVVDMPAQTSSSANLWAQGIASTAGNYANGQVKTGTWSSSGGGTWVNASSTANDVFFNLYYNGNISTITSVTTQGSPYFQWAREIYSSNAGSGGVAYCKNSTSNTPSTCDTSKPDPSPAGFPVTTTDYSSWEASAISGTTTGNITVANNTSSNLANTKISGNLLIDNNAVVYLTGNLWITGTLTLSNNATIRIDPSQGDKDFVILVDGSATLSNNGNVLGSGNANSFLLLASRCTSTGCPSGSIVLDNNTTAGALMAQDGTVVLKNNANAKSIMAKGATLSNNANVVYDNNLGYFSLGSTGATSTMWSIDSWQEVAQ